MSHGPGCGGEAVVRVQGTGQKENKVETKGEQSWVIVQAGAGAGGNREVVSKEISVRIIVACSHDIHDRRQLIWNIWKTMHIKTG